MAEFTEKSPAFVKQLEGKLHVVVKPHDGVHAQVYFEEHVEGKPAKTVPIPFGYQLICTTDTKSPSGKVQGRFFPIAYHHSYHLKRYGADPVLEITRLQLIK